MKKTLNGAVPHAEETIKELCANREFAIEYLKAALEELDDPDNRAAGLLALRDMVEAYGGWGAVAAQAGISREALYHSLSPKGRPNVKDSAGRIEVCRDALACRAGKSCSCGKEKRKT